MTSLIAPTAWSQQAAAEVAWPALTGADWCIDLDSSLKPDLRPHGMEPKHLIHVLAKANKLAKERVVRSTLGGQFTYHTSYLAYLEIAWGRHLTPVLTPDILWMVLLGELTTLVRDNAERVRHLFTRAEGKTQITVMTSDPTELPLASVIEALRGLVPTGVDPYIPTFTTNTPASRLAHYAAFCDMVSPYYDYCTLLCGFPAILVRGTAEDWRKVHTAWAGLPKDLVALDSDYHRRVLLLLTQLGHALDSRDPAFWGDLFGIEHCGSGDHRLTGWFRTLYRDVPGTVTRSPATAARVNYLNHDTQRTFSLLAGPFASRLEGTVLVPSFEQLVFETTP